MDNTVIAIFTGTVATIFLASFLGVLAAALTEEALG
jgi:hypothetical protein